MSSILPRYNVVWIPLSPSFLLKSWSQCYEAILYWRWEPSMNLNPWGILCRWLCKRRSKDTGEVPPCPPPATTQVQRSPEMEQVECHTASAPSQPPESLASPWSERGLEKQRHNQTACKDSSGSGHSGCPQPTVYSRSGAQDMLTRWRGIG